MGKDSIYIKWKATGTSKSKGLDLVFHQDEKLYSIECKHPHDSLGNNDNDKTQTQTVITSGTSVLHYKIISKIGAGGMGEVFLAENTTLKRQLRLSCWLQPIRTIPAYKTFADSWRN